MRDPNSMFAGSSAFGASPFPSLHSRSFTYAQQDKPGRFLRRDSVRQIDAAAEVYQEEIPH